MKPPLAAGTVLEGPPATTECYFDPSAALEKDLRLLFRRKRVDRQRALTDRSTRAILTARSLIEAANEQIEVLQGLQHAQGTRWYRFVRMRGGSSMHDLIAVTFTLPRHLAKQARRVSLLASFNQWKRDVHRLTRSPEGNWSIRVYLPPGRVLYHFDVDGAYWLDPHDEGRVPNVWGSEYSVRNVRSVSTRIPDHLPTTLASVQGGSQDLETGLVPPAGTMAFPAPVEVDRRAASRYWYRRPVADKGKPPFEYRTKEGFEASLLHVAGEVDASTAPEFEAALMQAITVGKPVVVSLGAVRYLDSSALRCLMRARSVLANRHQRLILAEPSPQVRRVIAIFGFDKAFPLFSSVEAAWRYLAGVAHDESAPRSKGQAQPGSGGT
jgi:anti-sigma B factor antagonist